MKFVDEYRDQQAAKRLADEIAKTVSHRWTLMEVCGGQTHAIMKYGIDQLLPDNLELLHGPGCPVCVTPAEIIDQAIEIADAPNVILCSFGDMMRVPGTHTSLNGAKASGADVRIVYSPLDAVEIATRAPEKQVVFLAIGFETTAPTTAMAVHRAKKLGLQNFSMLISHVRVPPALEALLTSPGPKIDAFLAAGHVCAIMGFTEYFPISRKHQVPIVVTGFEPIDILQGILMAVRQLEEGRADVENQYARVVNERGNQQAQAIMACVFENTSQVWRGIGALSKSGLKLTREYEAFDARARFNLGASRKEETSASVCVSGKVLRGVKKPIDCPAFGRKCTPEHPLGATMVSSEGACAAYFRYSRKRD